MTGEELYQALGRMTPEDRALQVLDEYAEHVLTRVEKSWYDDGPVQVDYLAYSTEWWEEDQKEQTDTGETVHELEIRPEFG